MVCEGCLKCLVCTSRWRSWLLLLLLLLHNMKNVNKPLQGTFFFLIETWLIFHFYTSVLEAGWWERTSDSPKWLYLNSKSHISLLLLLEKHHSPQVLVSLGAFIHTFGHFYSSHFCFLLKKKKILNLPSLSKMHRRVPRLCFNKLKTGHSRNAISGRVFEGRTDQR